MAEEITKLPSAREAMEQQLLAVERLTLQIVGFLCVCAILYGISASSVVTDVKHFIFLYTTGLLFAAIAVGLVSGGLLGFVFGIPKLLRIAAKPDQVADVKRDVAASSTPTTAQTFVGNTNLEEISDWLTKIIVGLTLVESDKLIKGGKDMVAFFEASLKAPGSGAIFSFLTLASLISGFLFFYLETRTRVTLLLVDADAVSVPQRVASTETTAASIMAPVGTSKGLAVGEDNDLSKTPEDEKLLSIPIDKLNTADEYAAWGAAQARAGRTQAAVRALREAVAREPKNASYLVLLADALMNTQAGASSAVDAYKEARAIVGDDPHILRKELFASLYVAPEAGFQHAIWVKDLLLQKSPTASSDPAIFLWTAAAYGQQYDWLMKNIGTEAQKIDARNAALVAVQTVIRLRPDPDNVVRRLLREMLEGSDPSNNDLSSLKDDSEFKALIIGSQKP